MTVRRAPQRASQHDVAMVRATQRNKPPFPIGKGVECCDALAVVFEGATQRATQRHRCDALMGD